MPTDSYRVLIEKRIAELAVTSPVRSRALAKAFARLEQSEARLAALSSNSDLDESRTRAYGVKRR